MDQKAARFGIVGDNLPYVLQYLVDEGHVRVYLQFKSIEDRESSLSMGHQLGTDCFILRLVLDLGIFFEEFTNCTLFLRLAHVK